MERSISKIPSLLFSNWVQTFSCRFKFNTMPLQSSIQSDRFLTIYVAQFTLYCIAAIPTLSVNQHMFVFFQQARRNSPVICKENSSTNNKTMEIIMKIRCKLDSIGLVVPLICVMSNGQNRDKKSLKCGNTCSLWNNCYIVQDCNFGGHSAHNQGKCTLIIC